MNAFLALRPRGLDAPTALPKRTNHSKAPKSGTLRKLISQPPKYGHVTSVPETPTSCPVAESAALNAIKHARVDRHKNGSRATVFDKGVKS